MYKRAFGLAFLITVLCLLIPSLSRAASVRRNLSSQTAFFDAVGGGGECTTTAGPLNNGAGGAQCYSQTVTLPVDSSILLVQVSATADVNATPNEILESVNVGGTPCINGENFQDDETGWINVQSEAAPFGAAPLLQDNVTTYEWCCAAAHGSNTVNFRIADEAGTGVGVENLTVVIDSAGPDTAHNGVCGHI